MIEGVGHNDIQLGHRYWEAINSFLSAGEVRDGSPVLPDRE
jgi:hypothetical protein